MRNNKLSKTVAAATGTINTQPMTLEHQEGYSYVVSFPNASTATGTVVLQGCNNALLDSQQAGGGPFTEDPNAVWVTISGSSQNISSGANTFLWNVSSAYYGAVRLQFVISGGTGTATYYYVSKGPQS